MGDVVNLRAARKAKERADKDTVAADNRLRFGRSKADRTRTAEAERRSSAHLDGHRLGPDAPDGA